MEKSEINKYRRKVDTILKEKTTDIESTISLIIVGALGFILTINEKFIGIKDSKWKCILFASIISLILAFAIFLFTKDLTTSYCRKLIDFIDNFMKPDDSHSEKQLLKIWEDYVRKSDLNRSVTYILLLIGISLELIFFMYNVLYFATKN